LLSTSDMARVHDVVPRKTGVVGVVVARPLLAAAVLFLFSCSNRNFQFANAADDVVGTVPPPSNTCSLSEHEKAAKDPNLHVMEYDVGDGLQTTQVYIEPDVSTFYRNSLPPSKTKVTPKFNGLGGKFINMSNKKVSYYWYVRDLLANGVAFYAALESSARYRYCSNPSPTDGRHHEYTALYCIFLPHR